MTNVKAPCTWAQRKDRLFVTIELKDTKNLNVTFAEDKISFSVEGVRAGAESAKYETELELFGKINPEESYYRATDQKVEIVGMKKESGPHWDKLLTQPMKLTKAWLTTNWSLYVEEEDEEEEGNKGVEGFGGYGNKSNLLTTQVDSDDEGGVDDRPGDIADIMSDN
eukprot:TRINITY_DN4307_c0_g3_i1.p1 TRINITY_DN4307_c0_g3~~TRINITY_DN4307_c0_g3_i1.p1  ORF type:complete len:167 (+),score=43.25 TRINITY_DN4307_c0_g3_i1:47-547(+)